MQCILRQTPYRLFSQFYTSARSLKTRKIGLNSVHISILELKQEKEGKLAESENPKIAANTMLFPEIAESTM